MQKNNLLDQKTCSQNRSEIMWTLGWGYSSKCDLYCPFCYSKDARQELVENMPSMAIDKQFLQNNSDCISAINFGTGECFLEPTFPALLEMCRAICPQTQIAVTTNGAIISAVEKNPSLSSKFQKCIHELDVSVDFARPETHDTWRGKTGTWHRAIAAISLGRQSGFEVSMVMIGTPQTLQEQNLREMIELAAFHDVPIRVNLFMPNRGDYKFAPSLNAIKKAFHIFRNAGCLLRSSDPLLGAFTDSPHPKGKNNLSRSCRMLSNGNFSPSTYLLNRPFLVQTNLSKVRLQDLLTQKPFLLLAESPTPKSCLGCNFENTCRGGSIERRWLWFNDLGKRDPLCPAINSSSKNVKQWFESEKLPRKWEAPVIHLDYLPTTIAVPSSQTITTGRCVKIILIRGHSVLLLQRHNDICSDERQWDFPGGRCHEDENEQSTLHREVIEEIGAQVHYNVEGEVLRWSTITGGQVILGVTYLAQWQTGEVCLSKEHVLAKWVPVEYLSNYLNNTEWSPHYVFIYLNSIRKACQKDNSRPLSQQLPLKKLGAHKANKGII